MGKSISELFPEDSPKAIGVPYGYQMAKGGNPLGSIVVIALVCVLAFLLWNKFGDQGSRPDPVPDDKKEQVEPAPKVAGKTLVFIHERNPQPIEHDLLLREMPKFCADRKLEWRALDDDLTDHPVPKCVEFAKSKGIDSPFVILTDADDKPAKVIKWPSGVEGLQELFK